ncbi:plasma-membrane proton-e [Artomyces pyxidatus]|uniref:Plasma-membrane proton-e n=1 Tax=Artomyces pyxidatus TaxID=48021 RepID=A0ACB8T116_9AGAM|nr:plasma-membrane proton-e [Artomyces pyxidatus]
MIPASLPPQLPVDDPSATQDLPCLPPPYRETVTLSIATPSSPIQEKWESKGVPETKYEHEGFGQGQAKATASHINVDMTQVVLKLDDLYDKEGVNLECAVLDDVFTLLQCSDRGLTAEEAQYRLETFGPNKLEDMPHNTLLQLLSFLWIPLAWAMEMAALAVLVSILTQPDGGHAASDWPKFVGIITLLLVNAITGFFQERSAGVAVKSIMNSLATKANVKRDGQWVKVDSAVLVPGDTISFSQGDIVPADCRLTEAVDITVNQATSTGEPIPVGKKETDQCFSGSVCKTGAAKGIVISTGRRTHVSRAASLAGKDNDNTRHAQKILAPIGAFCLITISIFVIAEIVVLYAGFRWTYRSGLDDILVLFIGGVPLAVPVVLPVTLALGAQQLAKHKAIAARISAIEQLASVTVLCAEKTGTLTPDKLAVDVSATKAYGSFSAADVLRLAAYASRTEDRDPVDTAVLGALGDVSHARAGIELLDFKPFNNLRRRTEATYRDASSGKLRRVTKGMCGIVAELCVPRLDDAFEARLEDDVEGLGARGFRLVAVAYDEVDGDDPCAEGNGYKFIGILALLDLPREDTVQGIEGARSLGVEVKMLSGDALAIAKETGRRVGLGADMYPARFLKDGPPSGSKFRTIDEMVVGADGFAGVLPEHKVQIIKRLQDSGHVCAVVGGGTDNISVLSCADVGIAAEGAPDSVCGAADIVVAEPGLAAVVDAIRCSRVVVQRMRSYTIYACACVVRTAVCFSVLAFAYRLQFPPFMLIVMALLNDGVVMTLSVDCVLPVSTPVCWDLAEIFVCAVVYGLYLAASTVTLVVVILQSSFFQDAFGVSLPHQAGSDSRQLHMVIYLQVAIISQALIFVTRSHSFSFTERPSYALVGAFCVAQLVSSVIAGFADWGFADVEKISGGWIAIVWVWDVIWFLPLDLMKLAMQKTVVRWLGERRIRAAAEASSGGVLPAPSCVASFNESLYASCVSFLGREVGAGHAQ